MAAVLACGPEAAISHRAAAYLWGFWGNWTVERPAEISGPRSLRWNVPGITIHRPRSLHAHHITQVSGIPVTTVDRTLVDLAGVVTPTALRRAVATAEVLGLVDVEAVLSEIQAAPQRTGCRALKQLLVRPAGVTRSELERRFLRALSTAGLPMPATNETISVKGRSLEVDVVWKRQGIVVELDGLKYHGRDQAFETDRERDRLLAVSGWKVIRVTWKQLQFDRARVLEDLAALLSTSGRHSSSGR